MHQGSLCILASLAIVIFLGLVPRSGASAELRCVDDEGAAHRVDDAATSLASSFARAGLPGAAAVLVHNEELSFVSFGRDSEGKPISADTHFYGGSLSKAFTAAAVLQLAENGLVDLDAPVKNYVPEFRTRDPRATEITVRQLLNHTSGLTNATYREWRLPQPIDLETAVARLSSAAMIAPGESFNYHNPNYAVLARLVEKVSGQEFGVYLRERIFVPLGMTNTSTVDHVDEARDGAAKGHIRLFGRFFPISSPKFFVNGAGGVLTTPRDYSIWLLAQRREGEGPNGFRVLSAESVQASHTPGPNAGEYGFGWNRRGRRVGHGGGLPNHAAFAALEGCNAIAVFAPVVPVAAPLREIALSGLAAMANQPAELPASSDRLWLDLALAVVSLAVLAYAIRSASLAPRWAAARRGRSLGRVALSFLPQIAAIVLILIVLPWAASKVISWSWIWFAFYFPMVVVALAAAVIASAVVALARIVALWSVANAESRRGH
ncbi:MAG TPA: serine hydrolase domain-containing protein [Steroidobacteraceae bacterium]